MKGMLAYQQQMCPCRKSSVINTIEGEGDRKVSSFPKSGARHPDAAVSRFFGLAEGSNSRAYSDGKAYRCSNQSGDGIFRTASGGERQRRDPVLVSDDLSERKGGARRSAAFATHSADRGDTKWQRRKSIGESGFFLWLHAGKNGGGCVLCKAFLFLHGHLLQTGLPPA